MNNNYGGKREGAGRKKKSISEKFVPLSFTAAPDDVDLIKKSYELSRESSQSKFILTCLDLENPTIIPGVVYSVYLHLGNDVFPELIKDCRSLYEAIGICVCLNGFAMIMAAVDKGHDNLWNDYWYKDDIKEYRNVPEWSFKDIDTENHDSIEAALKVYEEIRKVYDIPAEQVELIEELKKKI